MADATITIRAACPDDIERLTALLQALFSIEEDFDFDADLQRSGLELMLVNPLGCLLAAEANGKVVGMCSGQLTVSTAEGGPAALIEDVVVDKGWRGRGIGRLLMAAVEKWARKNRATRLQLLADRNNTSALGFYEKLNWGGTELICLRKTLR